MPSKWRSRMGIMEWMFRSTILSWRPLSLYHLKLLPCINFIHWKVLKDHLWTLRTVLSHSCRRGLPSSRKAKAWFNNSLIEALNNLSSWISQPSRILCGSNSCIPCFGHLPVVLVLKSRSFQLLSACFWPVFDVGVFQAWKSHNFILYCSTKPSFSDRIVWGLLKWFYVDGMSVL